MKVDVVIPFHPKDIDTLPWCIDGIKSHLPASRILVIGRSSTKNDVERLGAEFVDEDTVIPGLRFSSFSGNRWGWYFQQILKLGIADRIKTDYYLIVDADAVFLKDVPLFSPTGKALYATDNHIHDPYFKTFEHLFGFPAEPKFSFIVHHMLFNTRRIIEMREYFYNSNSIWHLAIIQCMEQQLPFSEYETYGFFMQKFHPEEIELRPLKWSDIWISPTPLLIRRLSTYYDLCAFHSYYRKAPIRWWRYAFIRFKIERRLFKFWLKSLLKQ